MTLPHPDWVCSVSADGDHIATGCGDGRVRLWSRATEKLTRTLDHNGGAYFAEGSNTRVRVGNRSPVFSVRLLRGGAVISGGQDQTVRIWSSNGECVATLLHGANVRGLAGASVSGGFIASVGGNRGEGNIKKLIVWRPPAPVSAAVAVSQRGTAPPKKGLAWGARRKSGQE